MGCLFSCCKPAGYEKLSENPINNRPGNDEFHADDLGIPNMDEINNILDQSDGDVNLSDAELEMYLEKLQAE